MTRQPDSRRPVDHVTSGPEGLLGRHGITPLLTSRGDVGPAVWRADVSSLGGHDHMILDGEERRRLASLTDETLRARFVTAHVATRLVLSAYLGTAPQEIDLRHEPCVRCGGPHGRPTIGSSGPHFSLASAAGTTLVAVAERPVGVDIERVPDDVVAIDVMPLLHPAEREEILGLPPDERTLAFARIWVRKEAHLKATGVGLSQGLDGHCCGGPGRTRTIGTWTVQDLPALDGSDLVGAVAHR